MNDRQSQPVTLHAAARAGCAGWARRSSGLTLIEVLVVISIIAVLVAVLVPSLSLARNQARRSVCGANLHLLGIASTQYLHDYQDKFWPYYTDSDAGRQWWFGFEEEGPGKGAYRPLDKALGVLAPYLKMTDSHLQCPAFPYGHSDYFPKFEEPSASYGYNINLVGHRTAEFLGRDQQVFLFADGAHFDFGTSINEGFYILYTPGALYPSGYGHFRHKKEAQVLYIAGHVEPQPLRGSAYWFAVGGRAGNLSDPDGGNAIYGIQDD